ncbi:hypothetical protein A0H81_07531 [Grifola frondosa]|uniref:HNH nuclease domain-containing protein n=1 Tax=Grifola frondosa TaxID=5627 RepID=A0A1C7M6W2_GRIFR|nr:hypothetical protein A0H81_07531 [Grifola frondosa]
MLLLGLCIHEQSSITIETIYRWLRLLSKIRSNTVEPEFVLRPVNVEPRSASYFCSAKFTTTGPDLVWNSKTPLQPGHYATFSMSAGWYCDVVFDTVRWPTFKEACASESAVAKRCEYPDWFDTQVRKRDGKCVITGTTTKPLATTWIVAPYFRGVVDYNVSAFPLPDDENIFLTVKNGLTMRQDIADLFFNNDIAIDVDDDFRVIYMQEPSKLCSKELLPIIPSHISLPEDTPEDLRPDLCMLRWHLKYSLLANGAADDVMTYYGKDEISAVLGELTGEDGDEMQEWDNELWQSPIGQLCLAWLLITKRMEQ